MKKNSPALKMMDVVNQRMVLVTVIAPICSTFYQEGYTYLSPSSSGGSEWVLQCMGGANTVCRNPLDETIQARGIHEEASARERERGQRTLKLFCDFLGSV